MLQLRTLLLVWGIAHVVACAQLSELSARDVYLRRLPLSTPPGTPAAPHFGLRYNVIHVDRKTETGKEVDPDSNFQPGDCLAIRLTPNRGGHLSVFNLGAAGKWQLLLPSPDAPHEPNTVAAESNTVIPSEGCFQIDETRGNELLMIVITPNYIEPGKLGDSLRDSAAKLVASHVSGPSLAGAAPEATLVGREFMYQKVKTPLSRHEPPHSVYVAARESLPHDRLLLIVKIRHE